MIRRSTVTVLVLLLAVIAFAFYWQDHKDKQAASATPTAGAAEQTPLFSAAEGQPTDISVKDSAGKIVEIARNADGKWVLKAPTEAEASQGSAEAAATQVSSLRVLASVPLAFDVSGLDKPAYVVTLKFSGGTSHTLNVGAETPIQDGYYTSLDRGPVRVVDKQGLDALIQLLSELPYAVTPTSPVALTPTGQPGTPTTEGTASTPVPGTTETPATTATP